jgi:hypothetical protein
MGVWMACLGWLPDFYTHHLRDTCLSFFTPDYFIALSHLMFNSFLCHSMVDIPPPLFTKFYAAAKRLVVA